MSRQLIIDSTDPLRAAGAIEPPQRTAFIRLHPRACFLLVLLLLALAAFVWQRSTLMAQDDACASANMIDQSLPAGSRWEICWEQRAAEGIVLHDVYYTTASGVRRKVLAAAGLAQIHVAYDDGPREHLVTTSGLGGAQLATLTRGQCPDGALYSHEGRPVLCAQSGPAGYAHKYYSQQKQSDALTLWSVSHVGVRSFIVRWRFFDSGTIEPALGTTGALARMGSAADAGWPLDDAGRVGVGFVQNVFWRLDFAIGENGRDDLVEEFNVDPNPDNRRRVLTVTPLNDEVARPVNPDSKRSWRVRDATITNGDGHAVSYHLEPMETGHDPVGPASEPWSQNDLFVTVYQACERFATHNPTTDGCGDSVAAFANGQPLGGADIVLWYGQTRHHLPRDEDEPFVNVRWDTFQIYPRDWTAQNPGQ